MITTEKINEIPPVVLHKVHAFSDEDVLRKDIAKSEDVLYASSQGTQSVRLLLDFTELRKDKNYSLAAHRLWAKGFKENSRVKACVCRTAVLGNHTPGFVSEKELMGDRADLHWFTEYLEAVQWLKS